MFLARLAKSGLGQHLPKNSPGLQILELFRVPHRNLFLNVFAVELGSA